MLTRMFKISFRRMKRSYLLLFFTLAFSVAALTVALLIVRSQKMQEADQILQDYGNYDLAFCEATQELEQQITEDQRFSELGYLYDLGSFSFKQSGNEITLGALEDQDTENMLYFNPVIGRYPKQEGEICVDRITLKCSGYSEKLGQQIPLSYVDENGILCEREFQLVGIIEVQKQDEGSIYCIRKYPEKMFALENNKEYNFPLAYISEQEAKKFFSCDKKHILANVSSEENSEEVLASYLGMENGEPDRSVTEQLHIDVERSFGREWTALCVIGKQQENTSSIAEGVKRSLKTGDVETDAYTKYFIPIFMGLIMLLSAIGIFDAVRLSMEERREVYGILLGMGMTGKRILKYMLLEFFVLLVSSVLAGWGMGVLGYQRILVGIQKIFGIILPSALAMDPYYQPYIEMATRNPWFWSGVIAFLVTVVGVVGVAIDLLSMTPITLEYSAIQKRKRGKRTHGLYFILNHYVGKESHFQQCLPYIMVCILMAVSVFGFCFFREKSIKDTAQMTERIEDARINGMDYYMKQTNTIFSGAMQYMHQSGVTEEMYQQLETNEAVEEVRGVVCNHSTALIYDQEEMIANVLRPQSEYSESDGNDVSSRITSEINNQYFQMLGIDTDEQEVFHVPTLGIRDEDLEYFEDAVIQGEIHPEKLQSGDEVLVVLTEESLASYFVPGESLPLYDVTRPEELDQSLEFLNGQMPEGFQEEEKSYSVSVDGVTRKLYCYDSLQKCTTRIGAVIWIDPEEDSFFFDSGNGSYQVNLMTGSGAFQKWGLPNQNYTSVGVRLKNAEESKTFDQVWMQVLQRAGYMNSIDVYSIIQEKERTIQQTMAIFYAVFGVLLLIGILCTSNSIAMRMRHMVPEQKILHQLGLTRGCILWTYIRRYSFMAVVGTVFSMLPVMVYSFLVKNALHRIDEALKKDATDALFLQKPWMNSIPKYDMLNREFVAAVIVSGVLAVLLLSALVLMQMGWLNKVLNITEQEEE